MSFPHHGRYLGTVMVRVLEPNRGCGADNTYFWSGDIGAEHEYYPMHTVFGLSNAPTGGGN